MKRPNIKIERVDWHAIAVAIPFLLGAIGGVLLIESGYTDWAIWYALMCLIGEVAISAFYIAQKIERVVSND